MKIRLCTQEMRSASGTHDASAGGGQSIRACSQRFLAEIIDEDLDPCGAEASLRIGDVQRDGGRPPLRTKLDQLSALQSGVDQPVRHDAVTDALPDRGERRVEI